MGTNRMAIRTAALAAALLFAPLVCHAITAQAQPAAPAKSPSNAREAYNKAVKDFRSVLGQRRAQLSAKQPLPNLPGQALYLARNTMISAYKDLTDAVPSRIGRPNKFGIPPAYFDADNEPLLDEYLRLFSHHAGAARQRAEFRDAVP